MGARMNDDMRWSRLQLKLEWTDYPTGNAEAEVPLGLIYIILGPVGHYYIEMGGKVLETTTKTLAEAKALATELYSGAIEDLILFHSNIAVVEYKSTRGT